MRTVTVTIEDGDGREIEAEVQLRRDPPYPSVVRTWIADASYTDTRTKVPEHRLALVADEIKETARTL